MPPGEPSFSIALVQDPLTVSAQFVADEYGGAILRKIGDRVHDKPPLWREQLIHAKEVGISLGVLVNGVSFDALTDESLPWRSLEIEARIRTRRWRSPENLTDLWGSVAGSCLSLILSGLALEAIEKFPFGLPEGASSNSSLTRYERNPVNRLRSIQFHGYACWACEANLANRYPGLGERFIEVHHILPVSAMPEHYLVNPVTEMVPLCPNCHRMVHQENPPVHPAKLREILGRPKRASVF